MSCGSKNLSRSGCTQNPELLNSVSSEIAASKPKDLDGLARTALEFFSIASRNAEGEAGEIAAGWLSEITQALGWGDVEELPESDLRMGVHPPHAYL